jgi:hypothetical protein
MVQQGARKVIAEAKTLWSAGKFIGENEGRKAALRAEWRAETAATAARTPGACGKARGFLKMAKKELAKARKKIPLPYRKAR